VFNVADPRKGLEEFSEKLQSSRDRKPAWIIDALFGIGLSRPLNAEWGRLIHALNDSKISIAAVDVPSGLNADTGEAEESAIRAEITLTVGAPKIGLLKSPAFTGRVEVLSEVGFAPCKIDSELIWTEPRDFEGWPPPRPVASNKGDFGHVAIIAGSHGYHGAGVVAAWGALRARPGLVTVYPQADAYVPVASQLQSAMVHPWRAGKTPAKNCSALLYGPGLAAEDLSAAVKKEMRTAWRNSPLAMVVDASALDWLQPGPIPRHAGRVITPHPGEAGRLLGSDAKTVQADRVGTLREISKKFGNCCVVLKGHQTLVGHSTGKIYVNTSGNPWLAQGGSGDLLSGYVAGLLAQPEWRRDPLFASRFAVWQHGAAADELSRSSPNWTIEELGRRLGQVSAR
jgi:NAD(P)H-hydrate epimerase